MFKKKKNSRLFFSAYLYSHFRFVVHQLFLECEMSVVFLGCLLNFAIAKTMKRTTKCVGISTLLEQDSVARVSEYGVKCFRFNENVNNA